MRDDPEFASVETFAEYLMDEDRTEFTSEELMELSAAVRKTSRIVRAELEAIGFKLSVRKSDPNVRGFKMSSHDRWYGAGSAPTHGGSGNDQILKFAGQKG